MKKLFFVSILCIAVSGLFAEMSIKDVLHRFDEQLARNSIPKAEVVIGSIHFGQTETHGSVASWMKDEITKAAVKTRRIKVVRNTLKTIQTETKTRGMPAGNKKLQSSIKKKYIITGRYIENKATGEVNLTLYFEISEGDKIEILATETAIIQSSELSDYGLTLYPENLEETKAIEKDFETAEVMLEKEVDNDKKNEEKKSPVKSVKTSKEEVSKNVAVKKEVKDAKSEKNQAVQITAFMLDAKSNVVDTLHPGDVVKFLVATDKDAYVKIMGIDANGDTFWLPIKDNFIKANIVRTFPDDNTIDYQVVDGVFGAEHLFIYASTQEEGLPSEFENSKYHPSLITNVARGMIAVKKNENKELINGVFKIGYTVVP